MNKRRLRRKLRRRKNDLIYFFIRVVLFVGEAVPRSWGLALFDRVGAFFHSLPTADRKRTRKHASQVLGLSENEAVAFSKKVYRSLGKNTYDSWYLSRSPKEVFDKVVHSTDLTAFRQAYDAGKGVIVMAPHLGSFELLLHFFARQGFKSFSVGRKLYDERVDSLAQMMRSGENITYLERKGSAKSIVKFLKEGQAFGALIDQDTKLDSVFAHFLGRLAHTPSAPMRMAMRLKTPVFVATIARQSDDTHMITVSEQIALEDTGDSDRDLCVNVERVNEKLSKAILENPEQWVWMHRRWRKQPSTPGCEDSLNVENYLEAN